MDFNIRPDLSPDDKILFRVFKTNTTIEISCRVTRYAGGHNDIAGLTLCLERLAGVRNDVVEEAVERLAALSFDVQPQKRIGYDRGAIQTDGSNLTIRQCGCIVVSTSGEDTVGRLMVFRAIPYEQVAELLLDLYRDHHTRVEWTDGGIYSRSSPKALARR